MGGGEQDGRRMIVACEMCACYYRGVWEHAPPKENLYSLRLLLMQSGTKILNKVLMTHIYLVQ